MHRILRCAAASGIQDPNTDRPSAIWIRWRCIQEVPGFVDVHHIKWSNYMRTTREVDGMLRFMSRQSNLKESTGKEKRHSKGMLGRELKPSES